MDPTTQELLDRVTLAQREQALTYLAGTAGAELSAMGRGTGTLLGDSYGGHYLDFGSGGATLITGHRDPQVLSILGAQGNHSLFRGEYGEVLEHYVGEYAQAISQRFPPDSDGNPRQVLFTSSVYEARLAAAQISIGPDDTGARFLFLLDAEGAPREGGEIQDEVHRTRAQGLKVIADETETGFGRCGTFSYHEKFGFVPDVVVLGPAGGAGLPFGAVVAPRERFAGIMFDNLPFRKMASPLVCSLGWAVIQQIDDTLLEHVRNVGEIFGNELGLLCGQFDHVLTAALGVGFMWTIKLNQPSRASTFRALCRQAGLLIQPNLRLTPPLNATEQQIRVATDAIAAACIDLGEAG